MHRMQAPLCCALNVHLLQNLVNAASANTANNTVISSLGVQGFMIKVVSSKYNEERWLIEEETMAVMHHAGLYFSLAWRVFYGFGLTVSALIGDGRWLVYQCTSG